MQATANAYVIAGIVIKRLNYDGRIQYCKEYTHSNTVTIQLGVSEKT